MRVGSFFLGGIAPAGLVPRRRRVSAVLVAACFALAQGCAAEGTSGRELTPAEQDASQADARWGDAASDADNTGSGDAAGDSGVGDAGGDAQTDAGDAGTQGEAGLCRPNGDGVVERREIALRVGLNAKFKVATNATFDTRGTEEGGQRIWDLAQVFMGEQLELVELRDPQSLWFAETFPQATYVARLSSASDLLGIFEITDEALVMHGVASPTDGFTRTQLTYSPPVPVLRFPLQAGATWTTESTVSGTFQGVASFYTETYTSTVDARGEVRTPYANFDALRVHTELVRTVGLLTTRVQSHAFVSECFGSVATVRSPDNQSDVEFTEAAEIRRLTP